MTEALELRAGRRTVAVSRPDKILFPADGVTKADLARYYADVARWMVPHVRDRPLTMERFPDGVDGERVFQKNISKYFPEWVPRTEVRKKGGSVTHVLAQDASTLVYLANQATITHHVWLSRRDEPDHPDQVVFDLDPSTSDFAEVRRTALETRAVLEDAGLVPFVKTTGSRGLHVVAPIRRGPSFGEAYAFAHSVAETLRSAAPKRLTMEFHKAERGGRIFLDINRNAYAQTAVAPYSVRPRGRAPVATPLDWSEVEQRSLKPDGFTIRTVLGRLERDGDPWEAFRRSARSLGAAVRRLPPAD